jgi:membrane protease YdiL (CAAX protease family)
VNPLYIPWDFALILLFLAIVVPWRGQSRMKRLLAGPDATSAQRLSLYGSTIVFQWLMLAIVALRCLARSVDAGELGISLDNPWRIVWTSVLLTAILCLNQVIGIRKIASVPPEQRPQLFAITERIVPRSRKETLVFAALSCTAGISEEFLYRGFVFMAFFRILVNYTPPTALAAISSSGWFSLAHLYQGRRGIATTFVVGVLFAAVRIWTGSLIPAVVAHIGIDLVAGICVARYLPKP